MHDLLEPLDDPVPFTVSPDLVTAAKARGSRLRLRRRLGVTGAMVPVILVLTLVAGAVYVDHRLDQVDRVDVAAGVLAPVAAGAPYNVLVVGTDSPVDGDGAHGDTIMIVHVDKADERLDVVSLPRDLVFREGAGTTERLGTFLSRGGPQALITAVHDHLGVDIAHYVEVDYTGFEKLIDAAGGVSLRPSRPLRDSGTGLSLDDSCQHLDGAEALQLARSRHVEYLAADGQWQVEPSGDLGRIQRQQDLLSLIFRHSQSMRTDPATVSTLLDVFADNTTIDAGFDRSTLLGLATWSGSSSHVSVAILSGALPVVPFTQSDGDAVLLPRADANTVLARVLTAGAGDVHDDSTLDGQPLVATGGPPLIADQFTLGDC